MSHIFTLQVSGIDPTGDYENRLYEAGCSDALIAVVNGTIFLDFDREGPSFQQAVGSATGAVESVAIDQMEIKRANWPVSDRRVLRQPSREQQESVRQLISSAREVDWSGPRQDAGQS